MSLLEDLFRYRRVYLRFRDNPLGPVLERYVAYLAARGCVVETCRRYAWIAEHFGRWLGRRPLSQETVRQFMHRHLPVCRCRTPLFRRAHTNRTALNRLLEMTGAMAASPEFPPGFVGDLLRRYKEGLVTVHGLAPGTVRKRLALTQVILSDLHVRRAGQIARWTPKLIERYVSGKARRYQPSSCQNIACATRSFLRFLLQEGLIRRDLSAAVPSFAHWRLASLPETLREEELARLIKAVDVRTPIGLRDLAMLLCMTELGMRVSDVAGLEIDGVDITTRVLRLRRHKERKCMVVPMTDRLADALDAYLRRGRPACLSQGVFIRHGAPVGKPISSGGICSMVLRLAKRAGLRERIGGTHILRHSVASRMLSAGATLKQVADLLGHQSIDTTTIYAKVDLNALSQVALPWPGAEEVQQ